MRKTDLRRTIDGTLFPLTVEKDPEDPKLLAELLAFALRVYRHPFLFEGATEGDLLNAFSELSDGDAQCLMTRKIVPEKRLEQLLENIRPSARALGVTHSYVFRSEDVIIGYAKIMESYYDDPTVEDPCVVLAAIDPRQRHLAIPTGEVLIHDWLSYFR